MKITKFQNPAGKLIRVLGNALEQQLSKTGTKIFAGTQKRYPQILDDLMKSYGDVDLNIEQADALSDFVKYAVTKDKINLTFDPQTKRFSWKEMPFDEAAETWKHLPVMQENPTIKFGFTEHRQPFKVPYMGGTLERVAFPVKKGFSGVDTDIVPSQIQFSWQRTPFDSYEQSFIRPMNGWNGEYGDSRLILPGHLTNMGLVPSHQMKSAMSINVPELDLAKMSREGLVETMRAVDDLVAPNATYLSGDFGDFREGSALFQNTPIGSELMQKFDQGTLTADKFMKILTTQRNPDTAIFMSNNTKGLSTDSFKLVGDFGGKKNNNLRWGGWQSKFNDLGTQNESLINAVKAFNAKELSKDEYGKIILDWLYKQFPSISSYEPHRLVRFPKYNWENNVFIRHPFALKGFKKGGKLPMYLKVFNYGKEITNI